MTRRVAIVGAGPRALHAIERLVAETHALPPHEPIEVDVFDPASPGAGPAYDPSLHPALLMNLRAELVDAWPRTGPLAVEDDADHPSLVRWGASLGVRASDYVPRALVGRYLAAAWARVLAETPAHLCVRHHRALVASVEPAGEEAWALTCNDGTRIVVRDVLLATGHGAPQSGDPRLVDPRRLAQSKTIGLTGAGLTAIDVLRVVEALAEEPRVHLVSRTGRPPVPKPVPTVDAQWRARLAARPAPPTGALASADALRALLIRDATHLVASGSDAEVRAALHAIERRAPWSHADACSALEAWIAAAAGRSSAHPVLALGAVWRWWYPRLVADASGGRAGERALPELLELAAAMEPVAFGPPVEAATSLHAALVRGTATLWSAPARIERTAGGGGVLVMPGAESMTLDLVLDARQRPPGVRNSPITAALLDAGVVSIVPGGRGLRTDHDAVVLGPSGARRAGLAVIGRATEDWAIGNDTLDRTLHDAAAAWARGIVHAGARAVVPA